MEWILFATFAAILLGGALAYRIQAQGTRAEPWILFGAAMVLLVPRGHPVQRTPSAPGSF